MHQPRRQRSRNLTFYSPSTTKLPKQENNKKMPNTSSSISRTSNSSSTTQACAACKYQRRKCAPDCVLAPYFPHDRQRKFLNAHKLFGVSNITKIIKNLNPPEKDEAMRTIIFQSDVRANDPVGGCYRIVRELQWQIEYNKAELDLVLHQLAICRAQTQQQNQFQQQETAADNINSIVNNVDDPFDVVAAYDPMLQFQYAQQIVQDQDQQELVVHQENQEILQDQDGSNGWTLQDCSSNEGSVPFFQLDDAQGFECDDDLKPILDINDVKFEADELVEKRFAQSTQLVMSS